MTNTLNPVALRAHTHVAFLDGWPLSLVTAPKDSTEDEIKQIAIDKISKNYAGTLTVADFRIVGYRETYVPDFLVRAVIEYAPGK